MRPLKAFGEFDRPFRFIIGHHRGDISGYLHGVESGARDIGPYNRNTLCNQVAILEKKWHPGNADDYDRVKTHIRVLLVEKTSRSHAWVSSGVLPDQEVGLDFKWLR